MMSGRRMPILKIDTSQRINLNKQTENYTDRSSSRREINT